MLLEFIEILAHCLIICCFCAVIFALLFLGEEHVFIVRKIDENAPSDADDVGARAEGVRLDAEAVERKNNVGGDE